MTCFNVAGDMALSADGRRFLRGSEAERIRKNITVGFQLIRGTWRYDLNKGIPYLEEVFGVGKDLNEVRSVFYDFLKGIRGVAVVDYVTLTFDRAERKIGLEFSVRTRSGETIADVQEIGSV